MTLTGTPTARGSEETSCFIVMVAVANRQHGLVEVSLLPIPLMVADACGWMPRLAGDKGRAGVVEVFGEYLDMGAANASNSAFQAAASVPPATTTRFPSSAQKTGSLAGGSIRAGLSFRAAAARHPSMIPLISARHEPQLVPALVCADPFSTLWQPPRAAEMIWLTPTPRQEQTVAPGSGMSEPGRPATRAKRLRG